MTEAKPYSKAQQLARGERRYRRKVASPKQWAAIREEKIGACRVCRSYVSKWYGLHHIIPRDRGGDDVADNLCPLCSECHAAVELREPKEVRKLLARLTDAEYAYAVGKAGEDWAERIYGPRFSRA